MHSIGNDPAADLFVVLQSVSLQPDGSGGRIKVFIHQDWLTKEAAENWARTRCIDVKFVRKVTRPELLWPDVRLPVPAVITTPHVLVLSAGEDLDVAGPFASEGHAVCCSQLLGKNGSNERQVCEILDARIHDPDLDGLQVENYVPPERPGYGRVWPPGAKRR